MRCAARIADPSGIGYRDCSRTAVWLVAHRNDRGVCTQHRRNSDIRPVPKEDRP